MCVPDVCSPKQASSVHKWQRQSATQKRKNEKHQEKENEKETEKEEAK